MFARDLVGELDSRTSGGGPTGLEPVDRVDDAVFLISRGGRQHQSSMAGVRDHGNAILRSELADQEPEGGLQDTAPDLFRFALSLTEMSPVLASVTCARPS